MACKRLKIKIICLGLVATLAGNLFFSPFSRNMVVSALDAKESEQKQSELKSKNEELNTKLKELKDNESEKKAYKETLDSQITVVEQQIDEANRQITDLDNKIAELEISINELQQSIDKNFEILGQRLKAIYMAGDTSTLDIILGAKDFKDFLDKREIIKNVSEHDSELIATLQGEVESIEQQKAEIEEARRQVAENKATLDTKKSELSALISENQKLIEQIEGEKQTVLDEIDQNDSELQKINAEIAAYYAQQAAASSSVGPSGEQTVTPRGSRYVWPVPGFYYLSSDYYDTIGRAAMHGAIDIAGSGIYGSKVVAAASGKVVSGSVGGWGGGYGTYLVIDHGNGYATLYAHMSGTAVSIGSEVKQGQTIGFVGSTGRSTGPHLHFETRYNGSRYNPMEEF